METNKLFGGDESSLSVQRLLGNIEISAEVFGPPAARRLAGSIIGQEPYDMVNMTSTVSVSHD